MKADTATTSNSERSITQKPKAFGKCRQRPMAVTSTVAQSFTVQARKSGVPSVSGESGLVTVNPDVPDNFVILPGTEDPMNVGTERLLRVRLEDQYANRISDSTVTFEILSAPLRGNLCHKRLAMVKKAFIARTQIV